MLRGETGWTSYALAVQAQQPLVHREAGDGCMGAMEGQTGPTRCFRLWLHQSIARRQRVSNEANEDTQAQYLNSIVMPDGEEPDSSEEGDDDGSSGDDSAGVGEQDA